MKNVLAGKTIVVTRATEQAEELISSLKQWGAKIIHIPTIQIVPPDSWAACDAAIENLKKFDWVVFTSTNGVNFFVNRLKARGKEIDILNTRKIAAVGESTDAQLKQLGLHVDLIPEEFRAEGLVTAFEKLNIRGQRILLPRAQEGREVLVKGLESLWAKVHSVPVYKNQPSKKEEFSEILTNFNGHQVDLLTFTSPSTTRNFLSLFGEKTVKTWLANGCQTAAIGGVTAEALEKLGLGVDILPKKSTIPDLVEAIVEYYA